MAKDSAKKKPSPKSTAAESAKPASKTDEAVAAAPEDREKQVAEAKSRLEAAGRNDPCPCGSGRKYKKCHLRADEAAVIAPVKEPDAQELVMNGWRLFEQRRPGGAA